MEDGFSAAQALRSNPPAVLPRGVFNSGDQTKYPSPEGTALRHLFLRGSTKFGTRDVNRRRSNTEYPIINISKGSRKVGKAGFSVQRVFTPLGRLCLYR